MSSKKKQSKVQNARKKNPYEQNRNVFVIVIAMLAISIYQTSSSGNITAIIMNLVMLLAAGGFWLYLQNKYLKWERGEDPRQIAEAEAAAKAQAKAQPKPKVAGAHSSKGKKKRRKR